MSRNIPRALALLMLVGGLSACSGAAGASPAETSTPAATVAPTATPVPGLPGLASYALEFSLSNETMTGGETTRTVYRIEVERVRQPYIQRVTIYPAEGQAPTEIIQTSAHNYLIPAEGMCEYTLSGESEPVAPEFFRPADLVGEGTNAQQVSPDETVNGVLAHHYVLPDTASADATTHSTGEVWVSVQGNFVVKYVLDTNVQDPDTGETGHIQLTYQIKDIGTAFQITEPTDCMPTNRQLPGIPSPTG